LLALAIAAFFTVISGMIVDYKWGWAQGVSIYLAILIIVSITSANDWIKDKSFVKLQSELKNEDIAVVRGKYGATQSVNVFSLVVGDVIILETGCRVPADCVLVEGQDVTVDETYYKQDNRRATRKLPATAENFDANPDCFLLSNTLIASGSGKAVVCAVGEKSRRGIREEKLDTTSKTPLQVKLQNLGGTFTKWALIAALVILVAYLINFIIRVATMSQYRTGSGILEDLATMFTLAITIVMVAVPEGLPLAVVMSLAYSVLRMNDDGVLVRNLNAPEVMGRVEEIITGKTGTLTKGSKMRVT
jgi:magnesium-transporting ATPase (P-type)